MRALPPALVVVALAISTTGAAADAIADDPAVVTVTAFDAALMACLHGNTVPLTAAIGSQFDVPTMAAFIVGPNWSGMAAADRKLVGAALQRYLTARFATEFDTFNGEQFHVDPAVQTRGPDKLVRTEVTQRNADPTHLDYRLRAHDGRWRIIDVYYNGISQLTSERMELMPVAANVPALVAHLDQMTAALR